MSFVAMGSAQAAWPQQQKKRREDVDSPLESCIREHVQGLQGLRRKAADVLDGYGRPSVRSATSLNGFVDEGRSSITATEQLFREWTVQLTGEPSERQRKKISFDMLQKAFREEVAQFKTMSRRAVAYQSEARLAAQNLRQQRLGSDLGDIDQSTDEEQGLLDESPATTSWEAEQAQLRLISEERQEGIRRIQGQVAEVNQVFRDLAAIVSDQGQHLATIEQHADMAASGTKDTVAELKKAVNRTRSARERLCWLLVTSLVLLCVLLSPHMRFDRSMLMQNDRTQETGRFSNFLQQRGAVSTNPVEGGAVGTASVLPKAIAGAVNFF